VSGQLFRPLFFTATATIRCIRSTAIKFLSNLPERGARKRRCIADECREDMPIPARSISTRAGAESLSTGTSTELDTHGREEAPRAPTLIREDRTQRGKCSVSSSSIRSYTRLVTASPLLALTDVDSLRMSASRAKIGPSAIGAFDSVRTFGRCRVRSLRSAPASLAEVAELERSELVQNRLGSPAEVRHASHRNEGSRL
jgi:hypothetical protein